MLNNFITKEIKHPLNLEDYLLLERLIKQENSGSILASLSSNLVKRYLEISIKSENLFFYVCEYQDKIIGYALLAKRPLFLISEFSVLKHSILINLLFNLSLKTIINIILSISKIDLFLLSKEKKIVISKNLNLNLLAINKNFQSKGIGKTFISNILDNLKKKYNFQTITVETFDKRAGSFYENKLRFYYIGKKLRFFKNLNVYKKEL